ncbi:MAG: hypothetical protein IJW24_04010 [Clostridia bacterium]|nr:hypothetical protein [Clostridia bacterium]
MFTTRRRSKRKILILMASFAAAIVAVFGVCGIILGQTKADMSKLALQTIENTLTSESEAVTVEIADSSFVGGSFGFGDSANVIIENCTLSNSEISVSGGNVTIVDSSITRNGNGNGLSVTGGNVTIVDSSISGCSNGIYVPTITEVPTINLFGSTTISGCSDFGVYMAPYISATLNLGYYMQGESDTSVHEYSQFSGSISGNGTGIYSGYNATTNIYAGEVKNNTNYGVSLNDSGHLYMIGNGSVSGSKIGVYLLQDSTFTLYGGSIKENRNTDGNGGGIYVGSTCTLSMSEDAPNWSAFVTNNSANNGAGVYV